MRSLVAAVALLAAGSIAAADPIPAGTPKNYSIVAKVCQGDPLGSVKDGDVKVLGKIEGTTVTKSRGAYNLVQSDVLEVEGGQVVSGYIMRSDFEPAADGKIRFRLTLEHTGVQVDSKQETVVRTTTYKRHDRIIKDGETVQLRWGKSADRDTWLELTVREDK